MAASITAEQLLATPGDGFRYELVRGELIQMPFGSAEHGGIGESFNVYFGYYIATHRLGKIYAVETGFLMARNPDTVRAPDFAYIRQERIALITRSEGYIDIPPDLCVEVMSPSDRQTDVEQKVYDWLDFGTRIVIVINPKTRETSVYRSRTEIGTLTEHDILKLEDLVPGWSLELAKIFI